MGELDHRTLIIGGTREELSLLSGILRQEFPSSADPPRHPMGEAALEALRSDPPDLVLALAGAEPDRLLDLLGRTPGLGTDISLVILAGEGRSELAGQTSALEAAEVLDLGPETGSDLARAIRRALDRSSETRERGRLQALIEVAREALSVIDPTGVVCYSSPSISRMLGYAPEERVGMNAVDDVHPEDRPRVRQELQRLLREPGYLPRLRYRIRHKNGEWRTHDAVARNRLDDPDIRGIVVSALDVTAEAEAQEHIRYQATLLNAVGQAVIATDLEGEVIYWNRAAEELYGWAPAEAVGRRIVELTAPAPRRAQAEEIMETLRRRGRWSGEFEVQRRDGSSFPAYVTNSPVIGSDGDMIGIIGVSSDLSDLKRTEEALRERMKELQTLHRVSQIVNRSDLSLHDRLQGVVDLLPLGWLHPEVTEARLVLKDLSVQTPDFRETPWMQSARIAPSTHLVVS